MTGPDKSYGSSAIDDGVGAGRRVSEYPGVAIRERREERFGERGRSAGESIVG
jgi:hypothetical protein